MRVEGHGAFQKTINQDGLTSVVVYDDFDNPIMVALEVSPRSYVYSTADQGEAHNQFLKNYGIRKRIIVDSLDVDTPTFG